MKNGIYKRSYKPFIIWIICFMASMIAILFIFNSLFNISKDISIKIIMLLMILSINIIMYIVYKGEYVYLINGGPSFDEALNSPPIRRKVYSLSHLKVFAISGLIALVYLILSFIFNFHIALDIILPSLSIVVGALLTIRIKF